MEVKNTITPGSTGSRTAVTKPREAAPRHGFTLVEMLTVIVIISILAGLAVVTVPLAIRRANEFTIRQEISQLETALEKYKQERGDYPPDFAGVNGGATFDINFANPADLTKLGNRERAAVLRHFRKAFPRYKPGACPGCLDVNKGTYLGLLYDISYATRSDPNNAATGITIINLNPATAMVFMLGGPPANANESTKLLGFSANPANPFARGGSRLPQLYEFDETRVQIKDGYNGDGVPNSLPALIPPHMSQVSDGSKAPYVYFRPRNRSYLHTRSDDTREVPFFHDSQEQGICTPYADTATFASDDTTVIDVQRWTEPTKYQIICAGLDGLFREPLYDPPVDPDDDKVLREHVNERDASNNFMANNVRFLGGEATNIAPEEDDNITSFTQGKLADRAEE